MSVIRIAGTGSIVPPNIVTNEQVFQIFPGTKSSEWILEKTGVRTRHWGMNPTAHKMDDGWYDTDVAEKVAQQALAAAKITSSQLDVIVYVGCTFEYLYFPDAACSLHERLGAPPSCMAYTVQGGCGALVYQLRAVSRMLWGVDGFRRALIVAVNTPSSFIFANYNLQNSDVLRRDSLNAAVFGDGGAAIVLERADNENEGHSILATWSGADHEHDPMIYKAGGSRNPTTQENVDEHGYSMDARRVFTIAPKHLWRAVQGLQSIRPFDLGEVDLFLFHQASLRILEVVSRDRGIPMEKILVNADRYGNTAAASIGILLDEAVHEGKIKEGTLLCLLGVGAGWQYGGVLVRW